MRLDKELVDLLLEAPDGQIDEIILQDIKGWNYTPTALQILFVMDKLSYYALASEFSINMFDMLLKQAIDEEQTTITKLKQERTWNFSNH